MDNQLFIVGVTLFAVLFGLTIGVFLTRLWYSRKSRQFRAEQHIPSIIGKWRGQWFDDAQNEEEPKIEDTIEIQGWLTNGEFRGLGHQPQFQLSYPILGEIDGSRVVTINYHAARYPYEPNRGIACLQMSRDGETMEGRWYGRRYSGELGGGKVKLFRYANVETSK